MADTSDGEAPDPVTQRSLRLADTRELPRVPQMAVGLGPLGPVLGGFVDTPERQREFEERLRDASEPPHLGRYDVLGIVGRGSVTTVLRAFDSEVGREVAIRINHSDIDGRHGSRMLREARVVSNLDHPHVMRTLHVDMVDRHVFLVMELMRGKTLRTWMNRNPRPRWDECLAKFIQAGEGLRAIHGAGLIHRDFKPSNAIIDDEGNVKVIDFRLVLAADNPSLSVPGKAVDPSEAPAGSGSLMGTPAYMPRAQLQGQRADYKSDQFAFCVALHEALYGQRPFEGETPAALLRSMSTAYLRPPPRTKVPPAVREVLTQGLAGRPEKRWPSMRALLDALKPLAQRRKSWWRP